MSSIVKFFDKAYRPPRGGWGVMIEGRAFPEGGVGVSESDTFRAVKRWRENNGTFTTDTAIDRELWKYWCSKEPERCRIAAAMPKPPLQNLRPGDVLRRVIYDVTGEMPGPNCPCNARVQTMNGWGWVGCWKNRETIYGWLREEAQKRGHEIESPADLFAAAWKQLRGTHPSES